jgi:hypothetical protein
MLSIGPSSFEGLVLRKVQTVNATCGLAVAGPSMPRGCRCQGATSYHLALVLKVLSGLCFRASCQTRQSSISLHDVSASEHVSLSEFRADEVSGQD